MKLSFAFLALVLTPVAAYAQDKVTLSSEVLVEKSVTDAQGKVTQRLEMPKVVTPGDPLVFKLKYKNDGSEPAENFVITNPIPAAVRFVSSGMESTVSVDGGNTYGVLGALNVKAADGSMRRAQAEDVTHVRFVLKQPIPAAGTGEVTFRGIVK